MLMKNQFIAWLLGAVLLGVPACMAAKKHDKPSDVKDLKKEEIIAHTPAVLWREPADITSQNLLLGPGGEVHQPRGTFTFVAEDLEGTNPKFVVQDQDGVKWKVKLGSEARPETAASRLVWAVGYFANEDFFVPDLQVASMSHLKRGNHLVSRDGTVHDVRLKRYLEGEKKIGTWEWAQNPFVGSRELDGLRVLMAVINGWDLKDVNNAVYLEKHGEDSQDAALVYMISDLGASFGTTGLNRTHKISKGNLQSYENSKFIKSVAPEYVDFYVPSRPALIDIANPKAYMRRLHLEWIGKNIPRDHVKWLGRLMGQLTPEQIRDAFRAAQYSPREVDEFTEIVLGRIAELNKL
jgi:hypothetical protein